MQVTTFGLRQQAQDKLTGLIEMPARGRGQRLPEAEFVTAYGQQECRGWRLLLDPGKHRQDGAGTHGMGGKGRVLLCLQRAKVEGCGGIDTGIDKYHLLALAQVQGVLDLQLEVRQQVDPGQPADRLYVLQAVVERRTQRIVTAGRIAPGKDQDRGRLLRHATGLIGRRANDIARALLQPVQHLPVRPDQADLQRHLAKGVGRA